MEERKSWASSENAKESHGLFECLAHNLSLLFEEKIKQEENLTDEPGRSSLGKQDGFAIV